jgi:metal-responsive CopG/Arc/MetJ family transcriptional regulator
MKTAISIPDRLFEAADRLARRLGMSRSELYAKAVAEFVDENHSRGVRERLDAVYAADPESSVIDPLLTELQIESLPEEEW